MKKRLTALLLLLLLLFLPACEVQNENPFVDAAFPVTVEQIIIQQAPERVVCLSPSYAEILYELGMGDRIVGRAKEARYPNALKQAAIAGTVTKPDINKILELKPSLLITQTSLSAEWSGILFENGIQVLTIQNATTVEALQQIYIDLARAMYGELVGEQKGLEAYKVITDGIAEIKAKLPKKRFTYLYSVDLEDIYVTQDTFESSMLLVFGDNYIQNGKHYAVEFGDLKLRPDKVFLSAPYELENAREHPELKHCAAVKKGEVYSFDPTLFQMRSARIVDALKTIAAMLYPQIKF